MKGRILHIMPYEKWTAQVMDSNRRNFKELQHRYLLYSSNPDIEDKVGKVKDTPNVIWSLGKMSVQSYVQLAKEIGKADRVVFHSIFMSTMMLFVVNLMGVVYRKKYSWFIWGGDVYNELWVFQNNTENIDVLLREWMRRWYIAVVPQITGNCELDFQYLKKYYFTKAEYIKTFYQLPFLEVSHKKNDDKEVRILIGNSGTETNQHIQSMKKIKPYIDKNTKIYVILSYGGNELYKRNVIRIGKSMFYDNFVPIFDFMPYKQYVEFISSMDIVIMNHNRQQGISNIINFLHMGTKIYMNPQNTFYHEIKLAGGIVFNMQEIGESLLEDLTEEEKEVNKSMIEEMNSDLSYRKQWKHVYKRKPHRRGRK